MNVHLLRIHVVDEAGAGLHPLCFWVRNDDKCVLCGSRACSCHLRHLPLRIYTWCPFSPIASFLETFICTLYVIHFKLPNSLTTGNLNLKLSGRRQFYLIVASLFNRKENVSEHLILLWYLWLVKMPYTVILDVVIRSFFFLLLVLYSMLFFSTHAIMCAFKSHLKSPLTRSVSNCVCKCWHPVCTVAICHFPSW